MAVRLQLAGKGSPFQQGYYNLIVGLGIGSNILSNFELFLTKFNKLLSNNLYLCSLSLV